MPCPAPFRVGTGVAELAPGIETFTIKAGIAQLARASAFQAEGRGFEPRFPLLLLDLRILYAHVAQLVEHILGKDEVHRFNPGRGLQIKKGLFCCDGFF